MSSALAVSPPVFTPHAPAGSSKRSSFWIPLLVWVFVITVLASFRVRASEDLWARGGFDWQVKYQAGSWVGLGLLAALLLFLGRADLRLVQRGALYWYCWFALIAVASSVHAPSPSVTAF